MGAEVAHVPPLREQSQIIAFQGATATWPQNRIVQEHTPSIPLAPRQKFALVDLNLNFPIGEMSLICGKLGSGKSLLLLGESSFNFAYDQAHSS
jgi:excinuclease UvrABC ATPase subunit